MIVLTPEAASAVRNAMARTGKTEAGLRIMIETGGCAGHKYLIGLDAEPRPDDTVVESGGIKVFIDPDSQSLLAGLRERVWIKPGTPGLTHRIGGIEKGFTTGEIS